MYTFGGINYFSGIPISSVYVYDPDSNTWAQLDDMPFAGWMMTASQVNGKIYLLGGLDQQTGDSVENPQALASVWEVSIKP